MECNKTKVTIVVRRVNQYLRLMEENLNGNGILLRKRVMQISSKINPFTLVVEP